MLSYLKIVFPVRYYVTVLINKNIYGLTNLSEHERLPIGVEH